MNYEEKSDLQLAGMVLVSRGIPRKIEHKTCFVDHGFIDGACVYTAFDPCNVWNDAGPIISDNGIGFHQQHDGTWFSNWSTGEYGSVDRKPLRAAMICFLKMKEK